MLQRTFETLGENDLPIQPITRWRQNSPKFLPIVGVNSALAYQLALRTGKDFREIAEILENIFSSKEVVPMEFREGGPVESRFDLSADLFHDESTSRVTSHSVENYPPSVPVSAEMEPELASEAEPSEFRDGEYSPRYSPDSPSYSPPTPEGEPGNRDSISSTFNICKARYESLQENWEDQYAYNASQQADIRNLESQIAKLRKRLNIVTKKSRQEMNEMNGQIRRAQAFATRTARRVNGAAL